MIFIISSIQLEKYVNGHGIQFIIKYGGCHFALGAVSPYSAENFSQIKISCADRTNTKRNSIIKQDAFRQVVKEAFTERQDEDSRMSSTFCSACM